MCQIIQNFPIFQGLLGKGMAGGDISIFTPEGRGWRDIPRLSSKFEVDIVFC